MPRRNRRVFPVSPADKTPMIAAWQKMAAKDPATIDMWWRSWPTAMIGMVCGPKSGVAVVDVDGEEGLANLERLENENGSLGVVPTVFTPSGGVHLYFTADSLPFPKSERRIAPKIDVRSATPDGDGVGYVIVPPSSRADGKQYTWETEAELTDAPFWLAFRACFNEEERGIIGANQALLSLIEASPRDEWRLLFEAFQANERAFKEAGREHGASVNGKALTLDHPYVATAINKALKQLADCRDGQNAALNATAWSIGRLLAGAHITEAGAVDRVRHRLFDAAMRFEQTKAGEPWTDRKGQEQARKTIESGFNEGLKNPRDLSQVKAAKSPATAAPATYRTISKPLSSYTEKKLEWLWPNWIPIGKITVAGGKTKVGKSQFGLWLIARVTKGIPFPSSQFVGGATLPKPKRAILMTAEDDIEDAVVPRALAADADL